MKSKRNPQLTRPEKSLKFELHENLNNVIDDLIRVKEKLNNSQGITWFVYSEIIRRKLINLNFLLYKNWLNKFIF